MIVAAFWGSLLIVSVVLLFAQKLNNMSMLCDLIARTAFAPTEMAIGTVTSFFGAPVVIYMMLTRRSETL